MHLTQEQKRPWPRCAASLRNGDPCDRAVARGDDGEPGQFCANHAKAHASKTSDLRPIVDGTPDPGSEESAVLPPTDDIGPKAEAELAPRGDEASAEALEPTAEPMPIASLRSALRGSLLSDKVAESVGELILEGLSASKDVYSTCPSCNKRHPVSLPDLNTRISAARALVEELEGKLQAQAKSVDEQASALAAAKAGQLESLTDAELWLLVHAEHGEQYDPKSDAVNMARMVLADTP